MRNKRIILGSACTIAVAMLCAFGMIHYRMQPKRPFATVPEALRIEARTGDILFSEGASFKSNLVRMASHCEANNVSHTGFLQQRETGLYVTHMSIDDGLMISEPIDTFIHRSQVRYFCVMRLQEDFDRTRLSEVLDSLLLLPMGFDNDFDMEDDRYFYCTELIVKALCLAECQALDGVSYKQILYPSDLAQNKALEEVPLHDESKTDPALSKRLEKSPLPARIKWRLTPKNSKINIRHSLHSAPIQRNRCRIAHTQVANGSNKKNYLN